MWKIYENITDIMTGLHKDDARILRPENAIINVIKTKTNINALWYWSKNRDMEREDCKESKRRKQKNHMMLCLCLHS